MVSQQPYRLFFFGAAWLAVTHLALWLLLLHGLWPGPAGNPVLWHGYEMIFGFAGAVIAGFLLTASANWTGRRTVSPPALLFLFLAWVAGRIAHTTPLDGWLVPLADVLFLGGLAVALTRVLWISGNRRNYRFIPIITLFLLTAIAFHAGAYGLLPDWRYLLLHAAVDLILILMVIMGGRVIPFFTERRLPHVRVEDPGWLAGASTLLVVLSVAAVWLMPPNIAAALSWFAACSLLARLFHWSPWATRQEPMLWILHIGYLWLAIALFVRGGTLVWSWMPWSTALHAILAGALACLSLGMMARVALGHSGREIRAPWWMVPAFVLVSIAAIPRLLTAWPTLMEPATGWLLSGGAWILAFAIYGIGCLPILLGPATSDTARQPR